MSARKARKVIPDGVDRVFGERVRMLRRNTGESQTQVAQAVQLGQAAMSRIELGKNKVYLSDAVNIARHLGVRLRDLGL